MRGALVFAFLAIPTLGHAHFALKTPAAYSVQDAQGLPLKSAPCGQADPATPLVATNMVTDYHVGDTVTVTVDETIFHPGHYRVAIAQDQTGLPADPLVTAGATPCGTAAIQDSTTTGVIVDNMLDHNTAFNAPQSFTFQLPAGMTCTNCTLQIVEFMSNHALNNPGGCFYHHCAQVNILPLEAPLPDAGAVTGAPADAAGSHLIPVSGGCNVGGNGAGFGLVLAVG
ncbi:MAG TPA: SCE4755 family polysaccharide monooxygenase-like protein, partial [Kofleriaceae bacterium]